MKVSKITRLLPFLMLAALLLGGILGKVAASYPEELSGFVAVSGWVGAAFLNILKMVIGPLILSSIITGVAGMGSASNLGRIGGKTIGLFLGTTVVAIVLGLFLVNIIKPGIGVNLLADPSANEVVVENLVAEQQNVGEILMDAIPSNITKAFVEDNMLQIIVFAILFGLFTTKIGHEQSKKILDFFSAVFHVMMKLTSAIIKLTPIGILGITVEQVARQGDVGALVSSLLLFLVTVFAGILIHFFVIIPLLLKSFGVKPYRHMKNMSLPLLTAFSTASSSATLPLSMDAVENKSGISNKITSFVLPLGATINMNGTALFECVSVIFLAQAYGVELTMLQQIIVVLTSLLAAVGAAGIPMAGFVMMTVILSAVGLPLDGIGLIMSVNFLPDMARTATNVWGDCAVAAIVAKTEGEKLNV
ncbi:MAG TPA: dicarboxylate/amino acid:cation symporter [Candidatus Avirikenella pullistercoris]|nr:dicarboxylate/amino acid:cation symporter [Candidatus Avirikenella pullistercoris]